MDANIFLYISIGLGSISAILLIWIVGLEVRLKKVFRGSKIQNIESLLADFGKEIDRLISKSEQVDEILKHFNHRLTHDISKCHTIRFNPFKDHGSNQSFATCIINDQGDGVVISSLYSREKVSVYAKPLTAFQSQYELTTEEKQAIAETKNKK